MNTRKQHPTITYEDLTAKMVKGKFGEYAYKSPRYGYKKAYKYNLLIYIYLEGHEGWFDTHAFKYATRKGVLDYLKEYKATSRKYAREVSALRD